MTEIGQIPTPALLLDLDKLERNLAAMAGRTRALGVALRPHIKSHKCVEIGRLQRSLGATGITVATLSEAEVFAAHGFDDITWAFPLIWSRIDQAMALASRVTLGIVIDSREALDRLKETGFPFHVWIKVDCGYHRAGVDPHGDVGVRLARDLHDSPNLMFDGILTHAGQSYHARGRDMLRRVAEEERRVMVEFADRLRSEDNVDVSRISVGSTPTMSVVEHLDGVTEARPGNYALYDHSQVVIGSCAVTDCAVTVLASVVSSQAGMNHSVIDAGALALSKDPGPADTTTSTMGEIFDDYAAGTLEPDTRVIAVSQEHGTVSRRLPLGSLVRILPNHSCLTVSLFDEFYVVRGDSVVDRWKIWRER
jgi:D-serine deaminase-like pyridoxal phosphate-dependent protein